MAAVGLPRRQPRGLGRLADPTLHRDRLAAALRRIRKKLAPHIVADGHLPRAEYEALLGRTGIVVSTAVHEFQGLSVLEAASAGARPLVPDALCYTEQYPPEYRYSPDQPDALAERLADWLSVKRPPRFTPDDWMTPALAPKWQALMASISTPA